jgi:putative membrane protein
MAYTPPISVILGLVALQVAYIVYLTRSARSVTRWKQVAFTAGVLTLFVALATPLDTLADEYLFTAHMVQHLLLTLVAAPLLLAGTPDWMFRTAARQMGMTRFLRAARHPLVAFFGFNVIFSLAHVPAFYELTLASPPLHAIEHLVFVGTAMLMWLPVISPAADVVAPYPPLGQVLYLFLQTVPASLVGALLSATSAPYYPTYMLAPRISGLSALEDQQLGGLIMWVGSGVYFLLATGVVFFAWAAREEAANRRPVGVH